MDELQKKKLKDNRGLIEIRLWLSCGGTGVKHQSFRHPVSRDTVGQTRYSQEPLKQYSLFNLTLCSPSTLTSIFSFFFNQLSHSVTATQQQQQQQQ